MQFDATNFILGAVLGTVMTFLLRLHALKSLQLDIKKLGVGLGVEGFEEKVSGNQKIDVSGSNNKVAGRDLIEKLDKLHTDFAEIQQSISHDHRAISNYFKGDGVFGPKSYIINTVYERGGERIAGAMGSIVDYWTRDGWKLEFFSSDYNGMDGIFLIFSRPSDRTTVRYFHGTQREQLR
jgi:hypothetical protein